MNDVIVGVIVNTHGLKGTVKVKSFTDFKSIRYQQGATLYIVFRDEHIPVTVDTFRTVKGLDYLDFEEFNDINQCEQYKGCNLVISEDQLHKLDDDEYYFDELIGMDVVCEEFTGTVVDVREVPRGELLVVQSTDKQHLIPFQKEFVEHVDKDKRIITLIAWEGLL